MLNQLGDWFDDRCGWRKLLHEGLYENVPGGARWRYVWGSTLVFTFVVQMITGTFLWMTYSPSAQTAWESVYYLQFEMAGGSLLRGIHHYTAQMMVVLLALHLMQVVIDGAYRAPREVNFWTGLILMKIVLGLALTGYLLPWDQKGYWATQVATKISGIVPFVGPYLQELIVGGKEYGHHTLTRFFALHAGVLPGALIAVLVVHLYVFRRHGIHAKNPKGRPDAYFWTDQVLKDAIACLVVLVTVLVLAIFFQAELGAPADPSETYDAARPEWYFLFLFQFLKFFHGETGEIIGAIVVPGLVMGLLFLMPIFGRRKLGHGLNVAMLLVLIVGAALLTALAWDEDFQSTRIAASEFTEIEKVLDDIEVDLRKNQGKSRFAGKTTEEPIAEYFSDSPEKAAANATKFAAFSSYRKSVDHVASITKAEHEAERARELAATGIPPAGALSLLRSDPKLQGPKLFRKHCLGCHDHIDENGEGLSAVRPLEYPVDEATGHVDTDAEPIANGAPNLNGFGSRIWLQGFFDPEKISHAKINKDRWTIDEANYFGNTTHREGDMAGFVADSFADLDEEGQAQLDDLIVALSAQAALPTQREADATAVKSGQIERGVEAFSYDFDGGACIDCHKMDADGDDGDAPDLSGYASRQWLIDFLSDPSHSRFYDEANDRMPAFAQDAEKPENNLLDQQSLELLVDWLRGDWYEAADHN